MDFQTEKEPFCSLRELFSGSSEQPVDLDVTLPDYCPDISRILKCQVKPQVTARQIVGDRLTVEGTSLVRLLYVDEEGRGVRNCELTSAFSTSFNLKQTPENPVVFTSVRVDFINCRAITKRRIDLHGAFTVFAHVFGVQREELLTNSSGAGVMMKKKHCEADQYLSAVQQPFTLSETFELDPGKMAEALVRFSASGAIADSKVIADKVIVKGEITIDFLYLTDVEAGTLDTAEFTAPFSQIIDLEGIDDDCICDVRLELLSVQAQLMPSSAEEAAQLETEVRAVVTAAAKQRITMPVITDAYSTQYEMDLQRRAVCLEKKIDQLNETFLCKGSISASADAVASVTDVWCNVVSADAVFREGKLEISGRVNVCLLTEDAERVPHYFEGMIDYSASHEYPNADEAVTALPDVSVASAGYRISGADSIEMRLELKLNAAVCSQTKENIVCEMIPDEQKPKAHDHTCALTLYYADEGESIWEIARRYDTSQEAISKENDLSGEIVETRGMLLIPAI
ncbi:MAG: DUF3794 domain-containing protein [Firmicutes bacterium]|nr:DUF3794 domain-containing protein [Bacillota bacterium]